MGIHQGGKKKKATRRSDYYEIKDKIEGWWHPYRISSMFFVTTITSYIFYALPLYFFVIKQEGLNVYEQVVGVLVVIFMVFQGLVTLFFMNNSRTIRYQKIQAYVLPIMAFMFGISPYMTYYVFCYDNKSTEIYYKLVGYGVLIGIMVMVLLLGISIQKVKKGALRKGGKGLQMLMKYGNPFTTVAPSVGIILLVTQIQRQIQEAQLWQETTIEGILFFVIGTVIYACMVYSIPEFILIAYCKTRFPSFIQKE